MNQAAITNNPFSLSDSIEDRHVRKFASLAEGLFSHVLGTSKLKKEYAAVRGLPTPEGFANQVLSNLGISYSCDLRKLKNIPKEGPLVVVANHPFGVAEGMVMTVLMKSIRPDVKIMANYMLQRFPEYDDILIPVDPYHHSSSVKSNIKGLRESIQWVKNGGALVVFPAGTVSHYDWDSRRVTDPEWSSSVGRLVQQTGAPVVPVYFDGHNSLFFQIAGMVHSSLQSFCIPRNLLNKKGKTLRFQIGSVISAKKLAGLESGKEVAEYLRFRTYLLGSKERMKNASEITENPIVPAVPRRMLEQEIDELRADNLLLSSKEFDVFHASSGQIPNLLHEIGRLRELSFRACGEGTGEPIDLDEYDEYYTHLFVWDRVQKEILGAYRMCPMQEIIAQRGLDGLYTHQFFRYQPEFFDNIKPALEMGRSFVQPKYQRLPASLFLLWRGIGHYVAKYPQYKILMGPVSISNDYQFASRQLIVRYLKSEIFDEDLSRMVSPKHPYPIQSIGQADPDKVMHCIHEIEEVSRWIADIDPRCSSVPVLLKHYLKLGGRIAGFNLDHDFCDVLDALIMVDFSAVESKALGKYMGKEKVADYLAYNEEGKFEPNAA